MTAAVTLPAPARPTARRLRGIDAARGVALLGMMIVHIEPSIAPDGSVTDAYLVASGRAAALFAVLAGIGLALASGGATPPRGRRLGAAAAAAASRAVVLLLIGLTLGAFDLVYDSRVAIILAYYGVLFLVAVPFLGLRPAVLIPLAVVVATVAPVLGQVIRPALPGPSFGNPTLESLADPAGLLREIVLTGYYPVLPWTAYILLGLGIGRLPLRSMRTAATLLIAGAGAAVAAKVISALLLGPGGGMDELRVAGAGASPIAGRDLDVALQTSMFGTTPTTSWWWLAVASPHSSTPLDLLHTMGTAVALTGLMLLVARHLGPLLWPLAAIGSMTLTLYTLHVVVLGTAISRDTPYALLWHVAIAFAVALPWRAFAGRGPLEALANRVASTVRDSVLNPPSAVSANQPKV